MREMTSSPGAVVRARELFFNEGTLPQGLVQEAVLRSWQRCAQRGRDAGEAIEFNHVSRSALSASAERNRRLIMASESPILRLADAMKGVGYGILVTDREGACVAVHGPIDSCGKMLRQALRPGIDLSETAVATNAMALAMAEGRPIGLCGPEHFFSQNQTFQCVAAPIFDASGALAGSIDITRDTGAPRFGAVSLILNCAAAIETALFLQTPAHCLVTLSWNIDAVISTPPAIVAFGADGEVLAVSRGARDLLELGAILAKLRFQDLFHGSYAHFLDQASQSNRGSPLTLQSGLRIFARALVVKRGEVAAVRADAAGKQVQLPEFGDEGCQAALHRATRALGADLPVLLRGETGTGKEVAARALHANSARRRGNFIAINCGAIPRDLIEGELFGYADGAYTGARRGGARGRIEEANGGTLFLDEIGDMPLELQTRADPRQHQQLRRIEGAGGQDHFLRGANLAQLSLPEKFNAGSPLAGQRDFLHFGLGQHRQVRPIHGRVQIVRRHIQPPPVLDARVGDRAAAGSFHHGAVVIGERRNSHRRSSFHHGRRDWVRIVRGLYPHIAALSAVGGIGRTLPVFDALVDGQHVLVIP
ncbi:sigma-54-dependent Fis family transcriptional regulator [Massilia eurypsychrophila]|uniref:Sigma-54-dependent Fis family transcriptional regulator n=1 Tax=Massilia eurypsychrophila TaxID=1485217 RepID=A0A2G8TBZ1_9BURK|nr:sigma-54-dependent Fis family transcriptional regulator [Massilia eurypsychrophila]